MLATLKEKVPNKGRLVRCGISSSNFFLSICLILTTPRCRNLHLHMPLGLDQLVTLQFRILTAKGCNCRQLSGPVEISVEVTEVQDLGNLGRSWGILGVFNISISSSAPFLFLYFLHPGRCSAAKSTACGRPTSAKPRWKRLIFGRLKVFLIVEIYGRNLKPEKSFEVAALGKGQLNMLV